MRRLAVVVAVLGVGMAATAPAHATVTAGSCMNSDTELTLSLSGAETVGVVVDNSANEVTFSSPSTPATTVGCSSLSRVVVDGDTADNTVGVTLAPGPQSPAFEVRFDGKNGTDALTTAVRPTVMDGGNGTDTLSYANFVESGLFLQHSADDQGGDGAGGSWLQVERIEGTPHGDLLTGSTAEDHLSGGAGGDVILGGNWFFVDDNADDVLEGGTGDDHLDGQGGNDTLSGGAQADTILGSAGTDTLDGGTGSDDMKGGAGSDTVTYAGRSGDVHVTVDDGDDNDGETGEMDTVAETENLTGGVGDDTLVGTAAPNALSGGDGDDTLQGRGSNDTLNGGNDHDIASYGERPSGTNVIATTPGGGGAPGEADTYASIEGLEGGAGNDTLRINSASIDGSLAGNDGTDTLFGDEGTDDIDGGAGNDTITGDAGNDTIDGGAGLDGITGGTGDDTIATGAGGGTVNGNDGADAITGGDGVDTVNGGSGDDTIATGAGGGTVNGNDGADTITGGDGADTIHPGEGDDTVDTGAANDAVTSSGGVDHVDGGDGGDAITYAAEPPERRVVVDLGAADPAASGGVEADKEAPPGTRVEMTTNFENVVGTPGADVIRGSDEANGLQGGGGDDTIEGRGGNDVVRGGDDDDTLDGGDGADDIQGNEDDDDVDGGAGADLIDTGDDDDTLAGGDDADVLIGGPDTDIVSYAGSSEPVDVSLDGLPNDGKKTGEGDQVVAVEHLIGTAGPDRLAGNQDVNLIRGGDGDDVLVGGPGDDDLEGGAGFDTASYDDRPADRPVTITVDGIANDGGQFEADTFVEVEGYTGGAGADVLLGSAGGDTLDGGPGPDRVEGLDGGDTVRGGDGDDRLLGGGGDDRLDGGPAADVVDGGAGTDEVGGGDGDDTLEAFDGVAEIVACGAGQDTATHDANDTISNCEDARVPSPDELPPDAPPDSGQLPPRDRDGDGVVGTGDCDDLNAGIKPGGGDVPGNGVDENCDGADAPFPVLGTRLDSSVRRVRRGLRIRRATLHAVPANATIVVRCTTTRRPQCPFRTRTRTLTRERERYSLRGLFGDRTLSTRAQVEVRVTTGAAVGRVFGVRLRARGAPQRTTQCLPPGATRAVAC